jgi:hypothetical protein
MNHLGIARLLPACPTLLLFISSCTLKVEKLEPYGINDQSFVVSPKAGVWQDTVFRFCCDGSISTHRSLLDKGNYTIQLDSKGTPAYNSYPVLKIRVNDSTVKELRLNSRYTTYNIPFSLARKDSTNVSLVFDQDGLDDKGNDRDVLIRSIRVRPATREDSLLGMAINNQQFAPTSGAGYWQDTLFRFCCNGAVSTPRSLLEQGRYEILLRSKGTAAYDVYPLIRVRLNDSVLQEITLTKEFADYRIPFVLSKPDSVAVSISFDHDGADDKGNDRDVFIQSLFVLPAGKG